MQTHCRLCGCLLTQADITRNSAETLADGEAWCIKCDTADAQAEAASLSDAESGVGLERVREVQFTVAYDE